MCKITGVTVEWYKGYTNRPKFIVQLDREPGELIYASRQVDERHTFYYAIDGAYVDFKLADNQNQRGFNGYTYRFKMQDGSEHEVKGPWSSRAGIFNKFVAPYVNCPVVDVNINKYTAGAVHAEALVEAAKAQGICCQWVLCGNEWTLEPLDEHGKLKPFSQWDNVQNTMPPLGSYIDICGAQV